MDVSAASVSGSAPAPAPAAANPAAARARLQMALLKKAIESQQEQAAELMRATEGKGQVLDIRA